MATTQPAPLPGMPAHRRTSLEPLSISSGARGGSGQDGSILQARMSRKLKSPVLRKMKSFVAQLNMGEGITPDDGGGVDPAFDERSGTIKVLCCRCKTFTRLWLWGLVGLAVQLVVLTLFGLASDTLMFEAPIYFCKMIPVASMLPWTLIMVRVSLLLKFKGNKNAEEFFDLGIFVTFFILTHTVAQTVFDMDAAVFSGLRYENEALRFSYQVRDLIELTEFPANSSSNMEKTLKDVAEQEEIWQWLQGPFLQNIYSCGEPGGDLGSYYMGQCPVGDGKLQRSSIRLRVLRADYRSCGNVLWDSFAEATGRPRGKGCASRFSAAVVNESDWTVTMPSLTDKYHNRTLSFHNGSFVNFKGDSIEGAWSHGRFASYPPSGYVLDLPDEFDEWFDEGILQPAGGSVDPEYFKRRKRSFLEKLEDSNFIGPETRFLSVETTLFSLDAKVYATAVAEFEMDLASGVRPSFSVKVTGFPDMNLGHENTAVRLPMWPRGPCDTPVCRRVAPAWESYVNFTMTPSTYSRIFPCDPPEYRKVCPPSPDDEMLAQAWTAYEQRFDSRFRVGFGLPVIPKSWELLFVWSSLCFYFLFQEIEEMHDQGVRAYFDSFFNILDLLIVALIQVVALLDFEVRFRYPMLQFDENMHLIKRMNYFISFLPSMQILDTERAVMGVLIVLVWSKWLKYLGWFRTLGLLSHTLFSVAKQAVAVTFITSVFTFGFAVAMYFLLGTSLMSYRSLDSTLMVLFRATVGDFDYTEVIENGHVVGAWLGFLFTFFTTFVILTMLVAIINEGFLKALGFGKSVRTRSELKVSGRD